MLNPDRRLLVTSPTPAMPCAPSLCASMPGAASARHPAGQGTGSAAARQGRDSRAPDAAVKGRYSSARTHFASRRGGTAFTGVPVSSAGPVVARPRPSRCGIDLIQSRAHLGHVRRLITLLRWTGSSAHGNGAGRRRRAVHRYESAVRDVNSPDHSSPRYQHVIGDAGRNLRSRRGRLTGSQPRHRSPGPRSSAQRRFRIRDGRQGERRALSSYAAQTLHTPTWPERS